MPARLKKSPANGAPEQSDKQLPDLKADALLNLTQKIKENLKKTSLEKQVEAQPLKSKRVKSKKTGRNTRISPSQTLQPSKLPLNGNDRGKRPLPASDAAQLQGKKRLRDGQIKGPSDSRGSVIKIRVGDNVVRNGGNIQSELEEDVLALGGTMDDYELVAAAPSDSEMEGDDKKSAQASHKSLGRDLRQFVRGLGIDEVDVQETAQTSKLEQAEQKTYLQDQKKKSQSRRALTVPVTNNEKPRPEANRSTIKTSSHLVSFAQQ